MWVLTAPGSGPQTQRIWPTQRSSAATNEWHVTAPPLTSFSSAGASVRTSNVWRTPSAADVASGSKLRRAPPQSTPPDFAFASPSSAPPAKKEEEKGAAPPPPLRHHGFVECSERPTSKPHAQNVLHKGDEIMIRLTRRAGG